MSSWIWGRSEPHDVALEEESRTHRQRPEGHSHQPRNDAWSPRSWGSRQEPLLPSLRRERALDTWLSGSRPAGRGERENAFLLF